ncbi:MAG: nuclear transport factor 2 family protein [Solirubrobacteraceae bacterium]
MRASPVPTDPAAQLQWLVDRAEISDLLIEFARALDARDGRAYAALYAEDGVLELPGGVRIEGGEQLSVGVARTLGPYHAVWHLSANHMIDVDGDVARTRSYLMAVHRHDAEAHRHATGAGWYDNRLRRTNAGWRLTSVRLEMVWRAGNGPLPGERSD